MRPRTLLALLLVVPLVDALFLIVVATRLGWPVTVALVVLTAVLGMLLLRAEGRATLARVQQKLARGKPPTDELLDGGLLIAAGAFLLTPGLVTDAVGFLFAFPLSRVPIRVALKRYVVIPYLDSETGGFTTGNVYVGGFPGDGDGGGFTMGGSFGGGGFGGGNSDSSGFDESADVGRQNESTDRHTSDNRSADSDERRGTGDETADVVDVDYTVEDDESKQND